MVDAVSQMGRTVLQQVATMRELTAGEPPDDGMIGIVKAGVQAFGEYMTAKASTPVTTPQLPPGQPQPQKPPEKVPEKNENEEYLKNTPPETILASLENAIKAQHDASELSSAFLDAMQINEGAAKIVREAGGVMPFFKARLGEEWISKPENLPYIQNLIAVLTNAARQRGLTK